MMTWIFDFLRGHALTGGLMAGLAAAAGWLFALVLRQDARASKAEEQRRVAEMKLDIKDKARAELVRRFQDREKALLDAAKKQVKDLVDAAATNAIAKPPLTEMDWEKESTDILNEAMTAAHADAFGSGKAPP